MSDDASNEALVAGACAALLEPEGIPFAALVTAPDLGFPYEGAG